MPYKEGCIFCDIAQHKSPANIEYEDKQTVAFWDITPKSPVHLLVIPKEHLSSIGDAVEKMNEHLSALLMAAKNVAEKKNLNDGGYRIVINSGSHAGQIVDHLHVHVLGGKMLGPMA